MKAAAWLAVIGILFTISWENGWNAPTQIQYATTPTSTWKTIVIAPAGDNSFVSMTDNNTITRGRFYYFRARHILDNGYVTPWSPYVGAVWLTGKQPEGGATLLGKDNTVVKIPGGTP